MAEVTILKMGDNIIVPIQVELHDRAAKKVQEDILKKIEETSASGLLIDLSAVTIVDSFLGRLIAETARMAGLMGAKTVLVGLKKEVVITILQLGMGTQGLDTALNMEYGLELLEKRRSEEKENSEAENET